MTLVCVRMEDSFGVSRITALADTRASIRRDDGTFKTVSDTTTKLFAVPVRCYRIENLTPVVGAWVDPYFETQIGLGFSGSCFEALTVIALISQSLSALVAPDGDEPLPIRDGLVDLIAKHCETYFQGHSGDGKPIFFLLAFGFERDKPWVAKFTASKEDGIESNAVWADKNTLETVGQDKLFQQYAGDWRTRIQKHQRQVSAKKAESTADGSFEKSLEVARHDVAERKIIEEKILSDIESEFVASIGGVLQRLELSIYGNRVVSGFTRDDRPYMLGTTFSVAPGTRLGPIPIIEKMGRRARELDTSAPEV